MMHIPTLPIRPAEPLCATRAYSLIIRPVIFADVGFPATEKAELARHTWACSVRALAYVHVVQAALCLTLANQRAKSVGLNLFIMIWVQSPGASLWTKRVPGHSGAPTTLIPPDWSFIGRSAREPFPG